MWKHLGGFVIRFRLSLLLILLAATGIMGFFASKVKLSYEFAKAIPSNNPKFSEYLAFKEKFGDDGNMLVIGIQTDSLFNLNFFNAYNGLHNDLKKVKNVEDVISVPSALYLQKDSLGEKLQSAKIFTGNITTQAELDSERNIFLNLPFYRSVLYNNLTHAYLIGVRINRDSLNSSGRTKIVADIIKAVRVFEEKTRVETHVSGLPLIRTVVADRLQNEMRIFLIGSVLLSALILLLFFRSFSTMLLSLTVVLFGVVWSLGTIYLCGYKITLLTALIPSLVVVIGIPNCIYFINKYHTAYLSSKDKNASLIEMVSKMGIVTLFCNITAAIGFAVFALTKSPILREFGIVSGLSIMVIFFISFILLPSVLSYLRPPGPSQTRYLHNRWITSFLLKVEQRVVHNKASVYIGTAVLLIFAIVGITRLKTVAYIVDDLPKTDKIYTDLKFFEKNFKGVMPLEIIVDTKRSNGIRKPGFFQKVDSLSSFISSMEETNRPISMAEAIKFFYQGFLEGDSASYVFPNEKFVEEVLRKLPKKQKDTSVKEDNLAKMLKSFMDTARQSTRISINMEDVGTKRLPLVLNKIEHRAHELFDSSQYKVLLTGTSITFLEGSTYIINGLKESILWAFLLIALCMLYLFRSVKILICSLLPNLIPLVITAGIMGWTNVPLKPSTVLVFSVALGIAIDITIRFLVNYRQELPLYNNDVDLTVSATIKQTGLSIVYTSLVLIAGFVIFCLSSFGGTFALGWLTSVTLLVATLTNLILLPVLLLNFQGKHSKK